MRVELAHVLQAQHMIGRVIDGEYIDEEHRGQLLNEAWKLLNLTVDELQDVKR